jgi:hypothetical protein
VRNIMMPATAATIWQAIQDAKAAGSGSREGHSILPIHGRGD